MAAHSDHNTLSWSIIFRRFLKEDEISDFQQLLHILLLRQVVDSMDTRIWSLQPSAKFSVKSLVNHFSASSPVTRETYKALWKFNSPTRVKIFVWIMLFGLLNWSLVMKRKLPTVVFCPLYALFASLMKKICSSCSSPVHVQLTDGAVFSLYLK